MALKVGIVGFGIMGKTYADALGEMDDAQLAAVSELNPKAREEAAAKHKCRAYESYREMFDKESLDAVIIAVPDFAHREPVIAAAEAGINILMEKPFAMTADDCDAMEKAIRKSGVKCSLEFSNRWMNHYVMARERVRAGNLGQILSLTCDLNDTLFVPTRMLPWAGKSSPAWFLMSHTADITEWVTDKKPARVVARGVKQLLAGRGIDTWDVIEALVEYEDGAVGRLTSGWVLPEAFPLVYEFKMRLVGSEAALDIDLSDQSMHFATHKKYEHPHTVSGNIRGRYVGSLFNMLRDFVRDIGEGRQPSVTIDDGIANTKFLLAVHESLATGKTVDLGQVG
jgi:predicted dehydrogenase